MNTSHIFKFNKCITYTNILHVNKNQPFSTTDLRKKSKSIQNRCMDLTLRLRMTTPSGMISPKFLNSSSISASDKVGSKFLTYTDLISSESDSHTHPPQIKKRISFNAQEIEGSRFQVPKYK